MNDLRHQVILFDLGGVLVEFDGIEPLIALTNGRLDREGARRFWLESPWVRRFEIGACPPMAFAAGIADELNLSISPDALLREFLSWEKGPYPGALDLLKTLRSHFTLACLSNNNILHWNYLRDQLGFGNPFHVSYLSHELGLIKPDDAVFHAVLGDLHVPGPQILFLDDNPECVEAALRSGIDARRVNGIESVLALLSSLYPSILSQGVEA
jgi:HAD superfamily hydrolase (TIGR01509 family)